MPHPTLKQQKLSILDEVKANQELLRLRLAGAISEPPPGVPESSLPSVPLIDLAPSWSTSLEDRKAVAAQIREACSTSGFFQISNHSITDTAINNILAQAEHFFHDLTLEQKNALHIRNNRLFRGYEAAGDTVSTYISP